MFRQVVDTTGINTNAADVNRQVLYQSLRQLGFSAAEATAYLQSEPSFTIRSNFGTGSETPASSVRTQAAAGTFNSDMTAATLRGLQAWLGSASNSLPQVAAQPRINTTPVAPPSPPSSPFAATTAASRTPHATPIAPPPPPSASSPGAELLNLPATGTLTRQPSPVSPQRQQNLEGISSFVEGAVLGNFSRNDSWSATAGNIVGGLNPMMSLPVRFMFIKARRRF